MGKITAKLPGAKILVAEDYFINQELIRDILELMECEVDIAEDGLETLKMYTKKEYDLILMDVQMPNLDGYDTTKEIRKREGQTNKRIPIIALTASALAEDSKKCLEAGMDAYLTKPLDIEKLEQTLKKYIATKVKS